MGPGEGGRGMQRLCRLRLSCRRRLGYDDGLVRALGRRPGPNPGPWGFRATLRWRAVGDGSAARRKAPKTADRMADRVAPKRPID